MPINWKELTAKFLEVRDTLLRNGNTCAYRMSYKQPWKFYREHDKDGAISILLNTYGND